MGVVFDLVSSCGFKFPVLFSVDRPHLIPVLGFRQDPKIEDVPAAFSVPAHATAAKPLFDNRLAS